MNWVQTEESTKQKIFNLNSHSDNPEFIDNIEHFAKNFTDAFRVLEDIEATTQEHTMDFWIFQENGLELFSYNPDYAINSDLMGGFLSAIKSFSQLLVNRMISTIKIKDLNLIFYQEPKKDFFIVGLISSVVNNTMVERRLKKIYLAFSELFYYETTRNALYDQSIFDSFHEVVETLELDKFT